MKIKFNLPISIFLGCVILGGFILATQVIKQNSIENQQRLELTNKAIERNLESKANQEKIDKEKQDVYFANNLKCQTLLKDLKQRWNNVVGIYYSSYLNTCIVKYTKNGKTEESPVEDMQDN